MFDFEKRGYNREQVDDYVQTTQNVISGLRGKNAELLAEISNLEDEIDFLKNQSLQAQEKSFLAIENENNNKKLYDLDQLISSWEDALFKIREKYGVISTVEKKALAFKNELQEKTQRVIDVKFGVEERRDNKVHHKELLTKMRGLLDEASGKISQNYYNDEMKNFEEKLANTKNKEKPKNLDNLVNKYLSQDNFDGQKEPQKDSTLENYFPTPNSSGFDLREAVNPKGSLDDIMADFDFYNPEQNLKNRKKIR